MIEADFVRIFFNQTSNQFTTQDAFQSKRMGCDFLNGGLCSDENHNTPNFFHQFFPTIDV